MRKFFNNKSAFTLTELVVSMGITGVLIVSTIYLVDLANKSSTNDDLAVARQTIEELMGNRKICESTLAIQPLPLLGKTPIPVIKNASTNLLESSGVDAHIKDATQGTTLAARITAENALTSSHAKFGKRVMVGEMYVKDLGAVTDGEEGAKGEIKSTTALRLLEFSVLLAVKNSQEKAGNKVKGYTKKVIFTGVVDTTVNPMVIQSCAADVSFGKKEAERALCEDMGGLTAWDSAKGICKKEEVQRAVAKKAVAVICASDTGIGGNLDSSGTTCSPPYWGKNCHFCGTNFWVKKIGPQGEVTCTNGSNDCFSNQCMLVDKSGTAKASTCTGADPEFGGTPSTHGDCSPAQTGYKLVAGTCLPSCKKRAALQGISTANYKLIAATQCRDALYGGIEWDDFTDSVKTYDTQGTDMVCCAKQGIAYTPPACTNTCPPGETPGPHPGCACSVGSPPTCPTTLPPCLPGERRYPPPACVCIQGACSCMRGEEGGSGVFNENMMFDSPANARAYTRPINRAVRHCHQLPNVRRRNRHNRVVRLFEYDGVGTLYTSRTPRLSRHRPGYTPPPLGRLENMPGVCYKPGRPDIRPKVYPNADSSAYLPCRSGTDYTRLHKVYVRYIHKCCCWPL